MSTIFSGAPRMSRESKFNEKKPKNEPSPLGIVGFFFGDADFVLEPGLRRNALNYGADALVF